MPKCKPKLARTLTCDYYLFTSKSPVIVYGIKAGQQPDAVVAAIVYEKGVLKSAKRKISPKWIREELESGRWDISKNCPVLT